MKKQKKDNRKTTHPLERKTAKIIESQRLILPNEHIIAGVSGGSDSMALLHVLTVLREQFRFSITAVYVDHCLRPDETEKEKDLVRQQAESLSGVKFEWGRINVKQYAEEHGLSIEHGARILRYRLFNDVAKKVGGNKFAVAHHGDDQAEEVLLRLLRGSGRKGLSGMSFLSGKDIIRPFLEVKKKEILTYMRERKIPYLEDSSNQERIYLRNRIRLDLIPYLEEKYNSNISNTLCRVASILDEEDDFLSEEARKAYDSVVEKREKEGAHQKRRVILKNEALHKVPCALQRRVIEMALWDMNTQPSFQSIKDTLQLSRQGAAGKRLHLPRGLRAKNEGNRVILFFPRGKTHERGDLFREESVNFSITVPKPGTYIVDEAGISVTFESIDRPPATKNYRKNKVEFLDGRVASFPLTMRSNVPGDRFQPLGAPGSKKVSDFFQEQKVPRVQRCRVPVLTKENRILSLLGMRIDHRARITEKTDHTLKITLFKKD